MEREAPSMGVRFAAAPRPSKQSERALSAIRDDTVPQEPAELDIDPYSEENILNPRPFQEALRETGPIVLLKRYDMYAVGRYEEVRTVLSDYKRFTTTGGIGMSDIRKPGAWRSASPITEVDPPQHTGVRAALTKVISPIVIRRWREIFLAEAELVADRVVERGDVDGVKDIAEAYVLKVFPDALGVDLPREHFLAIGEMNFNQQGPQNEIYHRSMEKVAPILPLYQNAFQREATIPGGFAEKIFEAEDAGDFAPGTAPLQVRSFLRAGVDTTIAGIGHTLHFLARHPDQFAQVLADQTKSRGAFEEAIRLESPAANLFRTTACDTELSGVRLKGDVKVAMFMGAGNRDPRKWPDADKFDLNRQSAGVHLALGAGDHICIGQMIARLEAECILSAIAKRVRSIELAGEPAYKVVNTLRTLHHLPLRLKRG
jgi:4-methoxybenzoate monooxygenase (O-demethylating)